MKALTLSLALMGAAALAQDAGSALTQAQSLADQARKAYPQNSWNIERPLWKQAAAAAEQAVAAAPNDATALKVRAQIYTDVRFWRKAELGWDAYLAQNASDATAKQTAATVQYNLGYAAYQRASLPEASAAFAKCLTFDPTNGACAEWGGRTALESAQFPQAVALYQQAVQINPQNKVAAYFAGVAQQASTYGPAATQAFSRAYQDYTAGDKQKALTGYKTATASAPTFLEAWRQEGRVALELQDAATAAQAYGAAAALPGANATDKYNLSVAQEGQQYGLAAVTTFRNAYSKYAAGDKAGAEAGFLAATQANANYAKAWSWLGRARYDQKNYTGAADAYGQAVKLDPNDKTSAYYLGLAQQGK